LAVAVEDAGFEIRDNIAWIYGSGFPKSLDVSKAIDKRAGAEREVVGSQMAAIAPGSGNYVGGNRVEVPLMGNPITSDAQHWEGWGTALKPAHEPVVVGRKPLVGTVAENVLAWGVGGLNIDGSRIDASDKAKFPKQRNVDCGEVFNKETARWGANSPADSAPNGRWPANVIFDEVTAVLLDEQTGVLTSGKVKPGTLRGIKSNANVAYADAAAGSELSGYGDSGGASRFFYVAKASRRDRNEGLEELEDSAPLAGRASTTGDAATLDVSNSKNPVKNFHPTVKPTQLMRYLIKLVTPPGGTVLDPFTGSGSTGKAALLDGFGFVGVELNAEYLPIIEGRLKWANEQGVDDERLF
jgi:site-specific DNA-methyltransferase (adenine-specific)